MTFKSRHAHAVEDRLKAGIPERIAVNQGHYDKEIQEHLQRYDVAIAEMAPNARVLDAGCGTGYGSDYLVKHGARAVLAVDISPEAIAFAKKQYSSPAITWVNDDCQKLERVKESAPFDLICSFENLEHLEHPEEFLRKALPLLDKSGRLIASVPSRVWNNRCAGIKPDAPPLNPYHVREYTREEFAALLSPYFEEITWYYQTFPQELHSYALLLPVVAEIWGNPLMRAGRLLRRIVQPHKRKAGLKELLPSLPLEVSRQFPGDYCTVCYIAVCSGPKR